MDITNIPQNLIKALEQKNTEQLAVLSRVLNLVLGKTVIANVESTAPVTQPEREELLKQTTAALAQLNQQSAEKLTPAVKTEIARLMQQQNLIQSPELKWINLVVNNRPLLTYSDRPLTAGQTVPVQLQSPQKLVLLDLPEVDINKSTPIKTQTTAPVLTTSNASNTTPLLDSKNAIAVNELLKNAIAELTNKAEFSNKTEFANKAEFFNKAEPGNKTEVANKVEVANKTVNSPIVLTKNLVATITDVLSAKLSTPEVTINKDAQGKTIVPGTIIPTADTINKPIQQNKVNFYSANDLSQKLSTQTENKHNSPEITAAKNIVSEQLRNILPHKDTPNVLLATAIQLQNLPATKRIELFPPSVEQALKSLAEKIRSPEQLAQPKALSQSLKNSGVFFENKLNHVNAKETIETHGASNKLNTTYSQDLKGSLLTLLNRVSQELSGSNKPITSEQTLKLFQNLGSATVFNQMPSAALTLNSKSDIAQNLGLLIQELMHKPVKELSNKELRTQLLVLLQQHSVHSLAKIQLQQLHSVNHELETKDTASPNASWQLEIPIKHHNDVQHLHLRIDREWIDEKKEDESEKSTNKIKQWSVTLRFDLPTLGEFCAQLAIVNTQVSATLWAASEKTFAEVRGHVEGLRKQLESEGINVKYLQCMRGMPPQKPMALSYSLIDIST